MTDSDVGILHSVGLGPLDGDLLLLAGGELDHLDDEDDGKSEEDRDAGQEDERLEQAVLSARVPPEPVEAARRAQMIDPLRHGQTPRLIKLNVILL